MHAELLPVAPDATAFFSKILTLVIPRLARLNAILAPLTPAPIITTSEVCAIGYTYSRFKQNRLANRPIGLSSLALQRLEIFKHVVHRNHVGVAPIHVFQIRP